MSGWTAIDNDVLRSKTLTVYDKAVYAVIKSHRDGESLSYTTIGEEANIGRRQAMRAVDALVYAGLISVKKDRLTNRYWCLRGTSAQEELVSERNHASDSGEPTSDREDTKLVSERNSTNTTKTLVKLSKTITPKKVQTWGHHPDQDDFTKAMVKELDDVYSEQEVKETIELALSHDSSKKYTRLDLYVAGWLRRNAKQERDRRARNGSNNGTTPGQRVSAPPSAFAAYRSS